MESIYYDYFLHDVKETVYSINFMLDATNVGIMHTIIVCILMYDI